MMTEWLIEYGYWGLFVLAFLAGSILPLGSEAALLALILPPIALDPVTSVLFASIGNTLGGLTCYGLGRMGRLYWIQRLLRLSPDALQQRLHNIRGAYWSRFAAFFTFLPIVGDGIAVALGYMRVRADWVTVLMFAGKLCRYAFIVYLVRSQ